MERQRPLTTPGGSGAGRPTSGDAYVTVASAAPAGERGRAVQIGARVTAGIARFSVDGCPRGGERELRDRLRSALLSRRLDWPPERCAVSVDVKPPVQRSHGAAALDLPIAMALLAADGQVPPESVRGRAFIGQLGLDGTIRPVEHIGALVRAVDSTQVVVPVPSLREARAAARDTGIAAVRSSYNLTTLIGTLEAAQQPLRHGPTPERAGDRYVCGASGDVFEALGDGQYVVADGPHGTPSQLPLGTLVNTGRPLDTWARLTPGALLAQAAAQAGPYLRTTGGGPVPDGWIAEPLIGQWSGHDAEIVYDPRRHDVAVNWHTEPGPVVDGMEATGWSLRAVDGPRTFWARDRHAAARTALARFDRTAPVQQTGPQQRAPDTPVL